MRAIARSVSIAMFAAFVMCVVPAMASASTWYITVYVTNSINPAPGWGGNLELTGYGQSCNGSPNLIDGDWIVEPPTSIAPGQTGVFEFAAPNLDEGADACADYSTPNGGGDVWGIYANDDVGSGPLGSCFPDSSDMGGSWCSVNGFGDQQNVTFNVNISTQGCNVSNPSYYGADCSTVGSPSPELGGCSALAGGSCNWWDNYSGWPDVGYGSAAPAPSTLTKLRATSVSLGAASGVASTSSSRAVLVPISFRLSRAARLGVHLLVERTVTGHGKRLTHYVYLKTVHLQRSAGSRTARLSLGRHPEHGRYKVIVNTCTGPKHCIDRDIANFRVR